MGVYKSDTYFYQKAIQLAHHGEHRVRVGCLAVAKGKPVAGTWNTIRNTSPVDYEDISIHAEMAACSMVSSRLLPATTLYIARLNKAGECMPSYPCRRCMDVIRKLEVKALVVADVHIRDGDWIFNLYKHNLSNNGGK